jgi:hypothetical protein
MALAGRGCVASSLQLARNAAAVIEIIAAAQTCNAFMRNPFKMVPSSTVASLDLKQAYAPLIFPKTQA